ncbi:hypothetical protein [Roseicella aquatilis]|uniref:Uncharacterized protein n=1 Tax=Roseicella aquatilis TaxID=2527868 RepID=A0A4R4D279_9PROT|nr:hypothetical protein [Roseicella aquatilis]TCZ52283.1 hypothetical protein EXY23_26280 [Roseicella aquatilis]
MLDALAMAGLGTAAVLWPRSDPEAIEHDHADLPAGHPHRAADHGPVPTEPGGFRHRHAIVIDDRHRHWPR